MKKVFIGCGTLLVVLAVAAVALTVWSKKPAEMMMNRAVKDAEKRIDRDITVGKFGGNPFTGFFIRDITIASKTEGMPDMLSLETLKFSISLPMLLKRKVVFSGIHLVRPVIYIERYASGEHTLYDIMESMKPEEDDPEKEKDKKRPPIFFERINLMDMSVKMTLHQEEGESLELLLEPIDVTLEPIEKGSYENFNVTVGAELDSLRLDASGTLAMIPEMLLELDWKTNIIDTGGLPAFMRDSMAAAEKIGLVAQVEASGDMKVVEKGLVMNSVIGIHGAEALSQKFGDGSIKTYFADGSLSFKGGIGESGASIKTEGKLVTGEEPDFEAAFNLGGISVSPALMMFLHEKAPEIITGTLGGDIKLSGPGLDMEKLDTGGNVIIRKGQINYPTPIPHGNGHGWAPIPYDRIDVRFAHTQPNITIKSLKVAGPSISASGNGTISYSMDDETGKPKGPMFFNISANADSPAVEDILALNQYLGPALSGNLSLDGRVQGNTADENALKGNVAFAFLDGRIVNPYQDQSSKLPLNANLSHYDFESLKGTVNFADSIVNTRSIALKSKPIDADLKGTLTFDGALKAHADTTLDPSVLATIADFDAVMPKIGPMLEKIDRVETSFELGGSLQEPQVHWNADEFAKHIGKKIVEKKAEKAMDKVMDKIDKKLGGDGDGDVTDTVKKKLKKKLKDLF